jgi:hypothetical protein
MEFLWVKMVKTEESACFRTTFGKFGGCKDWQHYMWYENNSYISHAFPNLPIETSITEQIALIHPNG